MLVNNGGSPSLCVHFTGTMREYAVFHNFLSGIFVGNIIISLITQINIVKKTLIRCISLKRSEIIKSLIIIIILIISFIAVSGPTAEKPYVIFPLLPPLLAIILAIVTKQVLPALFAGIWVGALMITGYNPVSATTQTLAWIISSATDSWNATILIFDFIIGAFVGILYASGSMHALARSIGRKVKSAKGSSFIAWLLGVLVFFDDYTNTIVVGNTTRPLTDKMRVSRELLSYIVDSTAAPVAGLALVSTWIGYEVGLIQDAFSSLSEEAENGLIAAAPGIGAYSAWLASVPFRFYSILAIILVLIIVLTRRHFGPMLIAEHRAVREGKVLRDGAHPLMPTETILKEPKAKRYAPAWVFIVSILLLIGVTLVGMWYTGAEAVGYRNVWWEVSFGDALMNSDAATALLWGSFTAYLFTLAMALLYRSLSFSESMEYTIKGMYLMVYANAILLLAWSLKSAVDAVGTADYVINAAVSAQLPVLLVPLIIFLVAMFISFTTGTSWGTFGIMMPLAIPLAWKLALIQYPDTLDMAYLVTYASIAAVFSGGIFGDHCSPISDTTIMSSMFSGADHIDHVSTQIPYAVLAAGIGIILYLLFAAGLTLPIILLPIGIVLLVILHRIINKWYADLAKLPPVVPNYIIEE